MAPGSNNACIPYKRLLGTSGVMQVWSKLRRSKFSQIEKRCPQNINKSLWFSGLGPGLSPWSHRFNPCFIDIFFLLDYPCCIDVLFYWINKPCSSFILLTRNKLYSILLAGIFPAKSYGMLKNKQKNHEPITFVFLALWKPIKSYNFFMASTRMFRQFISHNWTHKNPLRTYNCFLLGSHKK